MCVLFRFDRWRDFTTRVGDELYYHRSGTWSRVFSFVRMATVAITVSADAFEYLAISTISASHWLLFLGIYHLCGCIGFQLYFDVAIGLWKASCGGTSLLEEAKVGRYLEYPLMGYWITHQFRRIVHSTSCLRHNPSHRRRMRYPWSSTSTSLSTSRNELLENDIPISSSHDHRRRIFLSRLFPFRP